jgi:Winged helix-turn helix
MPRAVSPHQPTFSEEQLALARKRAQQPSAPYRSVCRARLTLALAANPAISHAAAAVQCGLKYSAVYKWRRRWAEGSWSLEDAPRPGRRPGFSP